MLKTIASTVQSTFIPILRRLLLAQTSYITQIAHNNPMMPKSL